MDGNNNNEVAQLEANIAQLTEALDRAKQSVQSWVEANSNLSHSAAEARAKNQGAGRGFLGGLLGSKYRAIARAGASASNASIAQEVAKKRAQIAEGKREAQEVVKQIQEQLSGAKQDLKQLKSSRKENKSAKVSVAKVANEAIDLMHKLKEAHTAGLLTDEEYEAKRQNLLAQL